MTVLHRTLWLYIFKKSDFQKHNWRQVNHQNIDLATLTRQNSATDSKNSLTKIHDRSSTIFKILKNSV